MSTKRQTPISHQHLPAHKRHDQTSFGSSFGRFGNSHQQFRSQMGNTHHTSHSDSNKEVEQNVQNTHRQTHFDRQADHRSQGHIHPNQQQVHRKTHVTVTIKSTQPPASTVLGIHQQKHSVTTKAPNNHPVKDPTSVKDKVPEQHAKQDNFRNSQTRSHHQQNHQQHQQASHAGFVISPVNREKPAKKDFHRSNHHNQP